MSGPHRLPVGGLVERQTQLKFTFDGLSMTGHPGDTLASALLSSGVALVGRSFKYHRPRGILTAGPEEPNALVELRCGARREADSKATTVELYDGLSAKSQNRWPSLRLDFGAVNSAAAPLIGAGFYYKTFKWPSAMWERLYEPLIRKAAGLGRSSAEPDPDDYEKANAFCDVLIIGSGPAGLMAALTAGRTGARVILCEEDFILGGRLNGDKREVGGMAGHTWVRQAVAELTTMPDVSIMPRTAVFGAYDGQTYGALERVADHLPVPPPHVPRQRLWTLVARTAVLAAGSVERPITFGGNDRPGIMLASAVRTYVNRFGTAPGQRVAICTGADDGWSTLAVLTAAGIEVPAIIDSRDIISDAHAELARRAGVRLLTGAEVVGTRGRQRLRAIHTRDRKGGMTTITCDALAVAGGWNPSLALSTHLGARPRWSDETVAFVPGDLPPGMIVAGAAAGHFALAACLRDGGAAGNEAARAAGFSARTNPLPVADDETVAVTPLWSVEGSTGKSFIDFQNDVTTGDVALAAREGFRSVEHLKRYTTLGMATDQGRTSGVNGHAILASLTGRSIAETGTTVFRPPYAPVAIGAFAGLHRGAHFKPTRRSAGHDWAARQGASFVETGQWLRAQWFPAPGEREWLETVTREARTVRSTVGICDVSTLGKIDIQGADAGAFLDRVYINMISTLRVGRTRYAVMLREDGLVMDDGTVARLGEDRFLVSTTTANAGGVMQHLEFCRQVIWPELDVQMVSVTEQWAQYAVAGPRSRELVQRFLNGAVDLSDEAFPHMACDEFDLAGMPGRLFRVSFSGERGYEVAVPARFGNAVAEALMDAGRALGVTLYGTEALGVLRIEKGHVAGNELNGQTTAADLGLGRMMSPKKDFIGRVLAGRPGLTDPDRPALVGVRPVDQAARLRAGSHLLTLGAPATLENDQGYLTSVAFSPMLGHWIGLGLLTHGPHRHGERVRAHDPLRDGDTEVEICSPVFFDPNGERLHA